jgi:hypothetical protein
MLEIIEVTSGSGFGCTAIRYKEASSMFGTIGGGRQAGLVPVNDYRLKAGSLQLRLEVA